MLSLKTKATHDTKKKKQASYKEHVLVSLRITAKQADTDENRFDKCLLEIT